MPSTDLFLAHRLDYLQRIGIVPPSIQLTAHTLVTTSAPSGISLTRITGIGRREKSNVVPPVPSGNAERTGAERLFSEDLLIGLHGHLLPLVFFVRGDLDHVAIYMGTWVSRRMNHNAGLAQSVAQAIVKENQKMLEAMLHSLYPVIRMEDPVQSPFQVTQPSWSDADGLHAGFVLGVPTIKPADPFDGALPLDRLMRALAGSRWAVMIMAEPVREDVISRLRNQVINEAQSIKAASPSTNSVDPLEQTYTKLLEVMLTSFTNGQSTGMWRTATYLLGDRGGYHRLASLWRSTFSGVHSKPDPVRVWEQPAVAELAARWEMLDELALHKEKGPVQHLFQYQSLLTSSQLAAYMHLPQRETHGFAVSVIPDFDAIPPLVEQGERSIAIGQVIHQDRPTSIEYRVSMETLVRHTFVSGVTGAGKTNTIFFMLKQALAQNIPFLIIEPAKTEYRALLRDPTLAGQLRIFTLGNETVSPLRLNPLEALPGTPVSVHIDLLRSVFNASFGLWSPLPQILEASLHEVYRDRGWDSTRDRNFRLENASNRADSFPTLSDLVAKVEEVIQKMGWEQKITSDLQASLTTRLNGLRSGGKGAMLDVQHSFPMKELLEPPTIIELEGIGDDEDKAFLMGLLLIRLLEYRRAQGERKGLHHLLVIEEAHRLLANVSQDQRQEDANPRGKAVESFSNLLAEIRAYGQGIIVADQVPVKLAPDIIKNTDLKIVHRIVAKDDREVLAGAMAMNEQQARILTTFTKGLTAVFSEGDDAPVLVQIPKLKDQRGWPTDAEVKKHMVATRVLDRYPSLFRPLGGAFDMTIPSIYRADEAAKALPNDPVFRRDFVRLVISIMEDDKTLDRLWDPMLARIRTVLERGMEEKVLQQCAIRYASTWFAQRRGSQNSWSYGETAELEEKLHQVLQIKLAGKDSRSALASLRACMYKLHARSFDPFPGCSAICRQMQPLCLYRSAVSDLIALKKKAHQDAWDNKLDEECQSVWQHSKSMAEELIDIHPDHEEVIKRIGLCYAQHMLERSLHKAQEILLQRLLIEASA